MSDPSNKLAIVTFRRIENERLFCEYLRLKYVVFAEEMHWDRIAHTTANRMTLPDAYDDEGVFCAALDQAEKLVAVARGTLLKRFADELRAQWYSHFAMLDFVKALDGRIATINAVAVRRKYRRISKRNSLQKNRVSDYLMKNMISELRNMGAYVIVLTAVAGPSYSLMRRIGFKTISHHSLLAHEYSTETTAPDLMLYDMAIITSTNTTTLRGALNELNGYLIQTDKTYHSQSQSNE